jgi:hypothetical protein
VYEINAIARITEDDTEEFTTDEKVRIPPNLENDLISRYYDDAVSGHAGIEKTLEQLRRKYTFLKMKEKVTQYIRKCSSCKQNKNERHAVYSIVQFLKLPEQP